MTDKTHLSWAIYAADVNNLAANLKSAFDPSCVKAIVGVARGGLVPATMLAHKLGVRRVDMIGVASYDDDTHKSVDVADVYRMCDPKYINMQGEHVIVVDDLIDSGKTFAAIKKFLPEALYVTVYAKQHNVNDVHFYSRVIPATSWVVFPYE